MVYNFFDKQAGDTSTHTCRGISQNQQLANELYRPITKKLKEHKIYFSFRYSNCAVDLADMQLISKYNMEVRFLLCIIDIYCKYVRYRNW